MWRIPNKHIAFLVVLITLMNLAMIIAVHLGYLPDGSHATAYATVQTTGTIRLTILPAAGAISTEFDKYSPNTTVNINGSGFTANGTASLDIQNSTSSSVSGFPKILSVNTTGAINTTWNISANRTGNYTISATDLTESFTVTKVIEVSDPYQFVNANIVSPTNQTVNTTINIFDPAGNLLSSSNNTLNFTFDFGKTYVIQLLPNLTVCVGINLSIANIGQSFGAIATIDRAGGNESTKSPPLDEICPFDIPINFTSITFTLAHPPLIDSGIYKCLNWNISLRKCTDENWTLIKAIVNGDTHTTVSDLRPGDPALAFGTTCGDGSCNGFESCTSCSDCGSCPEVAAAGAEAAELGVAYNPCTRTIKSLLIDLDMAERYYTSFNSCDNIMIKYGGVRYRFNIRNYLTASNSMEVEINSKKYLLKRGVPMEIDLNGDGKADMSINLVVLQFDSRFEIIRSMAFRPMLFPLPELPLEIIEEGPLVKPVILLEQIIALVMFILVLTALTMIIKHLRKPIKRTTKRSLVPYIIQLLDDGLSEREIVRKLHAEGWSDDAIAYALGKAISRRRRR